MQPSPQTNSFPTLLCVAALTLASVLVAVVSVLLWTRVFDGKPMDTLFAIAIAAWVWLVFVAGVPVFAAFASKGLLPAVKVHFALVGLRLVTSLALAAGMVKFGGSMAEITLLTLVSLYLPLLTIDSWYVARHLLKSSPNTPPASQTTHAPEVLS